MILAGGRSQRMGRDKALLPMATGQPLLLRTVQVAERLAQNIVVVTPWPERYRALLSKSVILVKEPLPPAYSSKPLSDGTTSDAPASAGPLSGFAYGWQAIPSSWCLLLACDLPYLDASYLQRWWGWLSALENSSSDLSPRSPLPLASLVPSKSSKKGWEPLCGYYHRRCIPSLEQQLESDQKAFQSWLSKIPIAPYQAMPEQMLFNCNTPGDWAAVCDRNPLAK